MLRTGNRGTYIDNWHSSHTVVLQQQPLTMATFLATPFGDVADKYGSFTVSEAFENCQLSWCSALLHSFMNNHHVRPHLARCVPSPAQEGGLASARVRPRVSKL